MWVGGPGLREGVLSDEEAAAAAQAVKPGDEAGTDHGISFTSGGTYAFGLGDSSTAVSLRMAVPVFHKPGISVAGEKAADDAWRARAHEIITNMNADWFKAENGTDKRGGAARAADHLSSEHASAIAARRAVWALYGRPIARLSPTGTNMWEQVDGEEDRAHEDIPLVLQQAFDAASAAARTRGAVMERAGSEFRGRLDARHLALLNDTSGGDEFEADAVSVASAMTYVSDDLGKEGPTRNLGDGVEEFYTLYGSPSRQLVDQHVADGGEADRVVVPRSLHPPRSKFPDAPPGDDLAVSGIGLMPLSLDLNTHPALKAAAAFANALATGGSLGDDGDQMSVAPSEAVQFANGASLKALDAVAKVHQKHMKAAGMRYGVYQVLVHVRKVQDLHLPQSHPHSSAAAAALLARSPIGVAVDVTGIGSDQREEMLSTMGPSRIPLPTHDRMVRRDLRAVVMDEEKRLFDDLLRKQAEVGSGGAGGIGGVPLDTISESGMTDLQGVIDSATELNMGAGAGNPALMAAMSGNVSASGGVTLPYSWVVDDTVTLRLPVANEQTLSGSSLRLQVRLPTLPVGTDEAGGNVVGEFTAPIPTMYSQQKKYGQDAAGGKSVGGDTALWTRWVALSAPLASEDAAVTVARAGGDACAVPQPGVHGSCRGFALVTVNIRPSIVSKNYIPGRGTTETSKRLALGPLLAGRVLPEGGLGNAVAAEQKAQEEELPLYAKAFDDADSVDGPAMEGEGVQGGVAESKAPDAGDALTPTGESPFDTPVDPHAPNPGLSDDQPSFDKTDFAPGALTRDGRPLPRRLLPMRLGYEGVPTAPLVFPPTLTPRLGSLIVTVHKVVDMPAMDDGAVGIGRGIDAYIKVACGGAVTSTHVNTVKGNGMLRADFGARVTLPIWTPLPTYGQARSLNRSTTREAAAAIARAIAKTDTGHGTGAWKDLTTGHSMAISNWGTPVGREVGGWGMSASSAAVYGTNSAGKVDKDPAKRPSLRDMLETADESRDVGGIPSASVVRKLHKLVERAASEVAEKDYTDSATAGANFKAPSVHGSIAGGGQASPLRHAGRGWGVDDGCPLGRVSLSVWDADSLGSDDRVAVAHISLSDIAAAQALRTEHETQRNPAAAGVKPVGVGPIWLPLYGARIKSSGVGISSGNTARAMNTDGRLGVQYRGTILVSFRVVDWAPGQEGLAEGEEEAKDKALWLVRGMQGMVTTPTQEENHKLTQDMGLLIPGAPMFFAPVPSAEPQRALHLAWPPPLIARMYLRHRYPIEPERLFRSSKPKVHYFCRYAFACLVLTGTDIPYLKSRTNVGKPSKMSITISVGAQTLVSTRETPEDGRVYWNQMLAASDWILPSNPSAVPDVIVSLTDRDGQPVGSGRIPAARLISTRWGAGPFWIPLTPDETTGVVDVHHTYSSDDRAGSVAVWMGMGPVKELFKSRSKKHRAMRKRLRAARSLGLTMTKEQLAGGAAAHFESTPLRPGALVPTAAARKDGVKQSGVVGNAVADRGAGAAAAAAPAPPQTLDEFMAAQAAREEEMTAPGSKLRSVHTLHDAHGKMGLMPSIGAVEEDDDDDTASISSQSTTNSMMSGRSAYSVTPLTAPTRGKKDAVTGKRAPRQREKLVDLSQVDAGTVSKRLAWEARLGSALKQSRRYQLRVFTYQARHLPAVDMDGASDPFLRVRLGEIFSQTHAVNSTLSPVWGTTVTLNAILPPYPLTPEIKVEVWDKNLIARNVRLASGRLSLADAMMVDTDRLYDKEVAKQQSAASKRMQAILGRIPITLDVARFIPTPMWVPLAVEHGGAWRAGDGVGATYGAVVAFAHPRVRGQHLSADTSALPQGTVGAGMSAKHLTGSASSRNAGYSADDHEFFYKTLQWLAPSAAESARKATKRADTGMDDIRDAKVKLNLLAEGELGPAAPCVPELLVGMQLIPRVYMNAKDAGTSWGTNMVEEDVAVPLSPPPQLLPPTRDVKVHMVILYAYGLGAPVGVPSADAAHPEVKVGFTGVYRKGRAAAGGDGQKNYSESKTSKTVPEVTAPTLAAGSRDVGASILQAFAGAGAAIGKLFGGGDEEPVPPPVVGLPVVAGAYARYNARIKARVRARAEEMSALNAALSAGGRAASSGTPSHALRPAGQVDQDASLARHESMLAPGATAAAERVLWEFSTRRYFVDRVELEVGLPDVAQLVWQVEEDNADEAHRAQRAQEIEAEDWQEAELDDGEPAEDVPAAAATSGGAAAGVAEDPGAAASGAAAGMQTPTKGSKARPKSLPVAARPASEATLPPPPPPPVSQPQQGGAAAAAAAVHRDTHGNPILGDKLPRHQLRALRAWASTMAPRIRLEVAEGKGLLGLGVGDELLSSSTTPALEPLPPTGVFSTPHFKGHVGESSMPLPLDDLWWATPGETKDDLGDDDEDAQQAQRASGMWSPVTAGSGRRRPRDDAPPAPPPTNIAAGRIQSIMRTRMARLRSKTAASQQKLAMMQHRAVRNGALAEESGGAAGGAMRAFTRGFSEATSRLKQAAQMTSATGALQEAAKKRDPLALLTPAETDGLALFREPKTGLNYTLEERNKMMLGKRRFLRRRAVYPLPLEDLLPREGGLFKDYPVYTRLGVASTGQAPRPRHKISGLVRAAIIIEDLSEDRKASKFKYATARNTARTRGDALQAGHSAQAARNAIVEGIRSGNLPLTGEDGIYMSNANAAAIAAAASTRSLYVQRVLGLAGSLQKVKVRVYVMNIAAALSCIPRGDVSYITPRLKQDIHSSSKLTGAPARLGVSVRAHICGQSKASSAVSWAPRSTVTYQRLEQDVDEDYIIPGSSLAYSKFGANRQSVKTLAQDFRSLGVPPTGNLAEDMHMAMSLPSSDLRQPYDAVTDVMQCLEVETTLPGVPLLALEVWHTYATEHAELVTSKGAKGKTVNKLRRTRRYHEVLLGGTMIDLEQRWLHPAWHALGGKYHVHPDALTEVQRQTQPDLVQFHPVPVETRPLVAPLHRALAALRSAADPAGSTDTVVATSSHGVVKHGPLELESGGAAASAAGSMLSGRMVAVPGHENRITTDNTDIGVTTGAMQLWVDIVTAKEAEVFKRIPVERPLPLKMVMRVTVWRVRRLVRVATHSKLGELLNTVNPMNLKLVKGDAMATPSVQQALARQKEYASWWGTKFHTPGSSPEASERNLLRDEDPVAADDVADGKGASSHIYYDVPMPPHGPPLERDRIAHRAAVLRALHGRKTKHTGAKVSSVADNINVGANVAVAAIDTVLNAAGEVIDAVDNKSALASYLPPFTSVPPSDELADRYLGDGATQHFVRACLLDPIAKHKAQDTLAVSRGEQEEADMADLPVPNGADLSEVLEVTAPGTSRDALVHDGLDSTAYVRPTHESWCRSVPRSSKTGSVVPQLSFVPQGMDPADADEAALHGGGQTAAAGDDDNDELPDVDGENEDIRTSCVKCGGCFCGVTENMVTSICCACCSPCADVCHSGCRLCCGAYKSPVAPPVDVKVESEHMLVNFRLNLPIDHERWGRTPPPDRLRVELCRNVPRKQLITAMDNTGAGVIGNITAGIAHVGKGITSAGSAVVGGLTGYKGKRAPAGGAAAGVPEPATDPSIPDVIQDRLGYVDVPVAQAVLSAAAQRSHTVVPAPYHTWEGAQRQWVAKDNHLITARTAGNMGGAGVCTEGVWLPLNTHAVPHVVDAASQEWGITRLPALDKLNGSDKERFQVLVTVEVVPEALVDEYPAGFGRSKPNTNPTLYNPGKMRKAAEAAIRAHKPPKCCGCVVDATDGNVSCCSVM